MKEYCCTSVLCHFVVHFTVRKSGGGLRSVKSYKFKKWGLEPNSQMEVYAMTAPKNQPPLSLMPTPIHTCIQSLCKYTAI